MRNDMRNIYSKKQINLIIMAVLSLEKERKMRNDMRNIYSKKQGQTHMEKGCKDLRIFIIQGNIIKKFDTEYGFADVKLSK